MLTSAGIEFTEPVGGPANQLELRLKNVDISKIAKILVKAELVPADFVDKIIEVRSADASKSRG